MLVRLLEFPSFGPTPTLACGYRGQYDLRTGISIYNLLGGVRIYIRVKLEGLDRLDLEELLESLGCHSVWTWGVRVL
jgi:hypothetical protein